MYKSPLDIKKLTKSSTPVIPNIFKLDKMEMIKIIHVSSSNFYRI